MTRLLSLIASVLAVLIPAALFWLTITARVAL
jgi:hypothetical protein